MLLQMLWDWLPMEDKGDFSWEFLSPQDQRYHGQEAREKWTEPGL